MDAISMGKKTRKEQLNVQALRRLKYLHTSLLPHEDKTIHSEQRKLNQVSLTQGLWRTECDGRFTTPRSTAEQHCFISLQPKTVRKRHESESDSPRIAKYKHKRKDIRTGRAPLQASTYNFSLSRTEEKEQFHLEPFLRTRNTVEKALARSSKSASEVIRSIDPHKCAECFVNDFEHGYKKHPAKKYCTNIRINRVTFSARPSGSNSEILGRESGMEVSKGRVLNGWGTRLQKATNARGNALHSDLKCHAKDAIDVTTGLQTLKLETKKERMRQQYADKTTPQPPPTPVRQIDVTLPQGMVLKYHLSEDE